MRSSFILSLALSVLWVCSKREPESTGLQYPDIPRNDGGEEYYGIEVPEVFGSE